MKSKQINKRTETVLGLALLFHLNYNKFFSLTEPYYYYIPLTQLGTLMVWYVAFFADLPPKLKRLTRLAALTSGLATALTAFIVTQYNLKMFFGNVDRFGDNIHRLYLEWGILNGFRILLVGATAYCLFRTYHGIVMASEAERLPSTPKAGTATGPTNASAVDGPAQHA